MSLRVLEPTLQVDTAVRSQLQTMARERGFRTRALAATPAAEMALAVPHPVFNLGLDAVGKRAALEGALMSGWRYFVMRSDEPVACAEAAASAPRGKATFSHTNEGPFVAASAAAVRAAEQWPEVRDGQFALGLLRVPALYVYALWLRDESGRHADLLVPLEPAPAPLVAGARIPVAAFEEALVALKAARGRQRDAN